jgi:hypothetical protein
MSGTRNSEILAACCLSAISALAAADDVRLADNARLTGEVRSISGTGAVELLSPLSPEPLLLKGDAVERVIFSTPPALPELPDSRVELINGDTMPAAIESYDGETLKLISPDVGSMEIPADMVRSIQLGVRPKRVVYSGPNGLDEWVADRRNANNWIFESATLTVNGNGRITKKINCPRHFILRFTMHWQGQPNFQVSFADPIEEMGKQVDRYYLQFGNAGMEIKRETAGGKRWSTIAQLNRPPDLYPDGRIDVEIRVDRSRSLIHLFINGEPEGRYNDPAGNPPEAGGISIATTAPTGTAQTFSRIELLEWDLTGEHHRAEERGDPGIDSLIIRRGDRYGGRLMAIRKSPAGMVYLFKSDFQDEQLEVPESEVSTLFLATRDTAKTPAAASGPFVLNLRGNCSLHLNSCVFSDEAVTAEHPLLGSLTVARAGVASFERRSIPPKAIPAP